MSTPGWMFYCIFTARSVLPAPHPLPAPAVRPSATCGRPLAVALKPMGFAAAPAPLADLHLRPASGEDSRPPTGIPGGFRF